MAPAGLLAIFGSLLAVSVAVIAVMYVVVPLFAAIGWLVRQVLRFIIGEVSDLLRIVGTLITQVVLLPLVILNILIGRWSAAAHFGRAFQAELKTTFACLYRVAIGHPARLLCLTALTDGLERRLPEVMAAAPTADAPNPRTVGQFEGYRIVGSLPGGGSGGKLYVAEPDAVKLAAFARAGRPDVRQVVIKTFSLRDGSSLPQIVRESRALEAAKRLGLVLEHELTNDRFYYVTQYVPGESLGLVTQRLHAMSDHSRGDGLDEPNLRRALGYAADLLRTLDQYHRGGLWHKDVKPDNIIVDAHSAHLVDFGLVTPLRSGMTLTTHGTEYFRDPELVRLALKGVKVHQVDGARFDVYAAGAVLFSIIENSFPAHGGLSQITKRCPEALRWIVRRAMTDYDKRYPSAAAMLADLEVVRNAPDPFAVRPIDLPSVRGESPAVLELEDDAPIRPAAHAEPVGAGSGSPAVDEAVSVGPVAGSPVPPGNAGRRRPRIRVNRWWSGGYVVDGSEEFADRADRPEREGGLYKVFPGVYVAANLDAALKGVKGAGRPAARGPSPARPGRVSPGTRRSAREQIEHARLRVKEARERARSRMTGRRRRAAGDFRTFNGGVVLAVLIFLAGCIGLATMILWSGSRRPIMAIGPTDRGGLAFMVMDLPEGESVEAHIRDTANAIRAAVERTTARNGRVRTGRPDLPAPRVVVNGEEVGGTPVTVSGEKVLVISDVVPQPTSVERAIKRLRDAGFTVLGNYPDNPAEEPDLQEQLDLEAAAKQVRGLSPLTAEDTRRELADWVIANNLDLLVWFTRVDPAKPAVQAHFFSAAEARNIDRDTRADARNLVGTGMQVMRGGR